MLNFIIEKVIVDKSGAILRLELHPPFAYLVSKYDEVKKRLTIGQSKNTTLAEGHVRGEDCSEYIPSYRV